jgi:tol-pal system protein YbgF
LSRANRVAALLAGALWAVGGAPAMGAPAPVDDIAARRSPEVAASAANSGLSELFAQLQALQEEVRELRGRLEEQSHQLARLEQQQKDNYLDLDGRLSALMSGGLTGPATAPPSPPAPAAAGEPTPGATSAGGGPGAPGAPPPGAAEPAGEVSAAGIPPGAVPAAGDKAAYDLAYELLKQGRMDEALAGFDTFVRDFPDSGLVPNAIYWTGEIYLVKNDQQAALERFSRVVESHPEHQKAADAHYKLGTLYLQRNDKAKARAHLERAVLAGGSVAVLAKRYLETHF